ncbi:VacB/Rnb family exoribonuclease [Chlamydia abortus]|nr:VacB/Rnb family exoribonuclease [Chlamydia abortus]
MVQKLKEQNFNDFIKSALLRTMQKAIYSSKNIGHFGLASKEYSHFTSPIRRYPDLLIHRLIRKFIFEKKYKEDKYEEELDNITRISALNSEAEKNAMQVERDVVDF